MLGLFLKAFFQRKYYNKICDSKENLIPKQILCELFIFDHNTDCFKQKIVQEATAKTQQIIVFFQIETQSIHTIYFFL